MNMKSSFIYDGFRISQEKIDDAWTMPYTHCHAAHEIYLLQSGERVVTIDNMDYNAAAHDATLFFSNVPHRSRGSVPFSGICIHFSERYLDLYFSAKAKKQLMRCFKNKVIRLGDTDFDAIQNIADAFTENAPDNFLKLAYILNVLDQCSLSADTGINSGISSEPKENRKKSQKILEYVDENYIYIKRISDITTLFQVSENYVFQVFRKNFNMTPKQYINRLRIRNACHRLKYTGKNMKSVAYDCGFDSYEHFSNTFKKTVGCTPTEYKKHIEDNALRP